MYPEELLLGIALIFLILVLLVFPVYVLIRLFQLKRDLDKLREELSRRSGGVFSAPLREQPPAGERDRAEILRGLAQSPPVSPSLTRPPEPPPLPTFLEPPAPPPSPPAPEPALAGKPAPDLESLLGANWLSKAGIAALILAAALFLKYAFDSGWIGPTGRIVIGLLASLALLGFGQFLLGKSAYRAFAQVLISGGIIIFFLSIFAAFAFYHLIGFTAAFASLAIAAFLGSAIALRNDTQVVALLCLLGAFLTPLLIHEPQIGPGAPIRLYCYLAGLNIWSALLLRARPWYSLSLLSLAATWGIFFLTRPEGPASYLTVEAFAVLFLLFACYAGISSLPRPPQAAEAAVSKSASAPPEISEALIIIGCLLFALASAFILTGIIAFGLPTLALIGVFLALLLIGLALLLAQPAFVKTSLSNALKYLSGLALLGMVMLPIASSPTLRPVEVLPSFIFIALVYLIFLAIALGLSRDPAGATPAILLIIANTVSQATAAFHVLAAVYLWQVSALPLWLPLAGWLSLLAFWLIARQKSKADSPLIVLLLCAQGLPLLGFLSAAGQGIAGPAAVALGLFFAEFLLVSLTWVALRKFILLPGFRGDLLGAFGNAAIFFGLVALALGMKSYQGLVILCGVALLFALYHAIIGARAIRREEADPLSRLIYLGLALTFLTIALPLQLKQGYLTLAWAAESAILVWTGLAAKERRTRGYGLILLAITVGKALLLDLGLNPKPFHFLLNERFLSGAAVIISAYVAAGLLWRKRNDLPQGETKLVAPLTLAANFLTLLFISFELWDYGGRFGGDFRDNLQQLLLSVFWSVYALGAVLIGFWKRARPVRLFAISLLYLAILKVFLFDLSFLSQGYRIISILGLAIVLLLVSFLYTRFEGRLKCAG
jgi:uncharacterized membrane protein